RFEKSAPELVARFQSLLDRHTAPDTNRRPMFGYPCAWINGNMATGLFGQEWWVRLSESERDELLKVPGAHPFEVMPGKAMGRYVVLPEDVVHDDARLDIWLARAISYTRSMPPKNK